jgi:hypothetical protein
MFPVVTNLINKAIPCCTGPPEITMKIINAGYKNK